MKNKQMITVILLLLLTLGATEVMTANSFLAVNKMEVPLEKFSEGYNKK